jgi:hypothetical protein
MVDGSPEKQTFIYWDSKWLVDPQKGWKTRGIRFKAENSLQLVIVDENNNKMLIQQIQVVISAIREYFSN